MPNARKKGQCVDYAVGGLKKLAYDPKVKGDVRLEALRLMLEIDQVIPSRLTGVSGQPSQPNPPLVDPLLAELQKQEEENKRKIDIVAQAELSGLSGLSGLSEERADADTPS
jgi:hypothetical protein